MKFNFLSLFAFLLIFSACENTSESTAENNEPQLLPVENLEKTLLEKLITAKDGDLILLPEGTFNFKRPLSLNDVPNVTIKGAGMKKTILSFKGQIEGAEGMIIKKSDGLTLEDFTVADSKGDAIKVQGCKNVTMRGLETTWTGGALETNGGYGLYPVQCTNVLMEKCEASYSSDAGIYVGQSTNIVVRENLAHHNVAGIEIENSRNAEVYKNIARNNAGGLLVFDMPDLPQANGYKIKVYDNLVENNNHPNFAPKGIVVATLPPGSGMTLMAHKDIEAYNNIIRGHKTVGMSITSWILTGLPFESEEYDPYATGINVYDNKFENNTGETDTTTDMGKLVTAMTQGKTIDILMDGIYKPGTTDENGLPTGTDGICIRNNGDVTFLNFNAGKGATPEEMAKNADNNMAAFDCSIDGLNLEGHDAWLAVK